MGFFSKTTTIDNSTSNEPIVLNTDQKKKRMNELNSKLELYEKSRKWGVSPVSVNGQPPSDFILSQDESTELSSLRKELGYYNAEPYQKKINFGAEGSIVKYDNGLGTGISENNQVQQQGIIQEKKKKKLATPSILSVGGSLGGINTRTAMGV